MERARMYLPSFAVLISMIEVSLLNGEHTEFVNVNLDAGKVTGPLYHFWESTGFCPPDPHQDFKKFFFSNDEIQNLAYIGSVPKRGIKQVRIHWLLDLVTVDSRKRGFPDQFSFNFTFLDKALQVLRSNNLRPGFELMGNPSNLFTDFDDVKQIYAWRDLIATLGKHLIETFGLHEVSQWNFESWNEPENKRHFDGLHVTTKGYLMYYDACSEGLKMAHPSLRLGGPATGYPGKHPIFWSLLKHCNNGTNFFTGERGVRLDFVSFHIKGQRHSITILHNEVNTLEKMVHSFRKYGTIPVYNDEGDPLVSWSMGQDWRADATYAAIVVKILAQHLEFMSQTNLTIRYSLLSNDNGFINYPPFYFRQRTLLARFQMNNSHPRKVEFIKKPVLSAMGLLALLGDQQLEKRTINTSLSSDFGTIASVVRPQSFSAFRDWELTVITYNSNDTSNASSVSNVNMSLVNLPLRREMRFVIYKLDDDHGNPFDVWKKLGSPVFPSEADFKELRLHQEPVRDRGPDVIPPTGVLNLLLTLPLPGVSLLHICAKPLSPPPKVEGVRLISVSPSDTLVTWKDVESRCILTFEVLYSVRSQKGPFTRLNQADLFFTSFHHHLFAEERHYLEGWYVIVAVDYWRRRSPKSAFSKALQFRGSPRIWV